MMRPSTKVPLGERRLGREIVKLRDSLGVQMFATVEDNANDICSAGGSENTRAGNNQRARPVHTTVYHFGSWLPNPKYSLSSRILDLSIRPGALVSQDKARHRALVHVYEYDVVPAERDIWEVLLAVRVGEMLPYVGQKVVKVIASELIQEGLRQNFERNPADALWGVDQPENALGNRWLRATFSTARTCLFLVNFIAGDKSK